MNSNQMDNSVKDALSGMNLNAEPIVCLIQKKRGNSEAEDYQTVVL